MDMKLFYFITLFTLVKGFDQADHSDFLYGKFPDNFMWGLGTAAYQIEGAWREDEKSESIWDKFSHQGKVYGNNTGDVAADSYHKWHEDIQLLKDIKVVHHRFSLAWTRIIPNPLTGEVNEKGIAHYNHFINGLIQAKITPLVTLYHWDLPQSLQDLGGWQNETLIGYFRHYADICFSRFGDRVKYWITFNEPWVVSWMGYGSGEYAPGIQEAATAPYIAAHNIIKSHARAYHLYNTTYRPTQRGKVTITLNMEWRTTKNESLVADREAAERGLQFMVGWFAHPIYKDGDYPKVMKDYVKRKSPVSNSRLPEFTEDEKVLNKGTFDYFGMNFYTAMLIEHKDIGMAKLGWAHDQDLEQSFDPSWPGSGSVWLKVVPWSLRRMLGWIKKEYNNVPVMVTENGVTDNTGDLNDNFRIDFHRSYANEMLKAIKLDGCNVIGYTAWSLLDLFEWSSGYHEKFGMVFVNFSDPTRPRIPKKSSVFYKTLILDNGFPQLPSTKKTDASTTKPGEVVIIG